MEAIIRKIKSCLALAGSDNPHEAAAAMRQAKKLMAQHGIGESMLDVSRTVLNTRYARPPAWLGSLGFAVGQAFGCSVFTARRVVTFVGPTGAADIAAYCFEVVLRSLEASKSAFIKRTAYLCSAPVKKQRATSYCEGFVMGAQRAVDSFAPAIDKAAKQAHRDYLTEVTGSGIFSSKKKKTVEINPSLISGFQDGEQVQIRAPIHQQQQQIEFLGGRP